MKGWADDHIALARAAAWAIDGLRQLARELPVAEAKRVMALVDVLRHGLKARGVRRYVNGAGVKHG